MLYKLLTRGLRPLSDYRLPELGGTEKVVDTGARTKNDVTAGVEWKRQESSNGTVEFVGISSDFEAGRFPHLDMVDFHFLGEKFGLNTVVVPTGTSRALLVEKFGDLFLFDEKTGQVQFGAWDLSKAKIIKSMWAEGKSAATISKEKTAKSGVKQSGYSPRTVADYVAAFNAAVAYRADQNPSPGQ